MATDWGKLKTEYINGTMTYAELAKTHGINDAGVEKRGEREGWKANRREIADSVGKAATAAITEAKIDELTQFNENDLKIAKAFRAIVARHLKESGSTLSTADLRALVGAAAQAQQMGRLALGATTANSGVSSPDGGSIKTETVHTGFSGLAELAALGLEQAKKDAAL